jgi:hypothetical protein
MAILHVFPIHFSDKENATHEFFFLDLQEAIKAISFKNVPQYDVQLGCDTE